MIENMGDAELRELRAIKEAVTMALTPFYQRQVPPVVAICALTVIARILLDNYPPAAREDIRRSLEAFLKHGDMPQILAPGSMVPS